MALPLWLMRGPRAFDERRSVRLLCVVILSCWFAQLALMCVYPASRVFEETFPEYFLIVFLIFTSFRLRAITAAWLVGLCVVTFRLAIYLWLRSHGSTPELHSVSWVSRGNTVSLMYLAGIVVCIQFELRRPA